MVTGRHLLAAGIAVTLWLGKPPQQQFEPLISQFRAFGGTVVIGPEYVAQPLSPRPLLVIDALFGFSFKGPTVREPYRQMLVIQEQFQRAGSKVVAVDVPSGWPVDAVSAADLEHCVSRVVPDCVISLTAAKPAATLAERLGAKHYLGGNFLPPALAARFGLASVRERWQRTQPTTFIEL
jgi:NAD(P)H-hydrate repair Nnr-like enzyme with NAD(P)H-hydrate epimerase domain